LVGAIHSTNHPPYPGGYDLSVSLGDESPVHEPPFHSDKIHAGTRTGAIRELPLRIQQANYLINTGFAFIWAKRYSEY